MSWSYSIIGLLLLILIHELGHFVVARLVGAKATRFLVGFPPVALSFRRGETEYGLGFIPLGGYVRIVGMSRPQASDVIVCQDAIEELAVRRRDGQREIFGPAVSVLKSRLDAGGDDARVAAERALLGLDAEQDLLHPKTYQETRKGLERLRDDLDRRAYWRLAVWRRIAIVAAGPAANVLAAIVILSVFFWHGVPLEKTTTAVGAVSGKPALAAGLQPGDSIIGINGIKVAGNWELVTSTVQASKGSPIVLRVSRGGVERALPAVRPEAVDGRWLLGFSFRRVANGVRTEPPLQAIGSAFAWSWFVTRESLIGLKNIVATEDGHKQVSSIVGITAASEESVQQGSFLWTLGVISLALAIFNLLPFLPLDGGHILVAAIEKLRRGRPLSRLVMERVSIVGIVLMLALFMIGLSNDIGRFTGP